MNQIAIAMFALAFVRLASGQACLNAQTALVNNPTCASAVDAATVCMGTCRTLYDDIISNCDDTTAATYINLLDTLCSPCAMAVSALTSDATCINATDVNTICMGTCRTLYDNIISNCDNATIPGIATVTNICTPCGRAQSALISDTTCANITDANTLCMGTCRILYDDIISSCDSTTAADFVITIDTICGPCGMALSALESDTACINATDANTLCMGTCRGLYDNIISNCNAAISAGYNTTISTLCSGSTNTGDRCGIAGGAIDDACLTSLGLGDNTICTGSCGSQLATAAAACTTSSDEAIQGAITAYNGLCGFEAQCAVATNEFNAVSTCEDALQSNNIGALCSASCRSLLEGVQNSCPTFTGITQDALNQGCDESGSGVLQASGIITLLLVAIFAFIV